MALLAGIRNLIGRRREPAEDAPAPEPVVIDLRLSEEIEAKPPEPAVVDTSEGDDDEQEFLDSEDLDDLEDEIEEIEEIDEIDIAERLEEMESRLGAGGADIHRLVKTLDGNLESHAARSTDLVQQLDERIQSQASETRQVVQQLDERFGLVAEESKRLAEQVDRLPALTEKVTGINEQCARLLELIDAQVNRADSLDESINDAVKAATRRIDEAADRSGATLEHMRSQLDATVAAVAHADERFERLAHDMRHIEGRTAGLDEAIKRVGRSAAEWEATFPALLNRTRKSMLMFLFVCMTLGVLALVAAVFALLK